MARAASVPVSRPRPVSAVVVSPAVVVLVRPATIAGASIGEIHNRDGWPAVPVPVILVLQREGRVAGGHEVVIPGTLDYFFLLAAAHADQLGDQLSSGRGCEKGEHMGIVKLAIITSGGLEVAEPVLSMGGDECLTLTVLTDLR